MWLLIFNGIFSQVYPLPGEEFLAQINIWTTLKMTFDKLIHGSMSSVVLPTPSWDALGRTSLKHKRKQKSELVFALYHPFYRGL